MKTAKKAGLAIMITGYLLAGVNHFWHPAGYIRIIPRYIPYPQFINLLAGFFEILFGALLILKTTRKTAAWAIVLMLIAFLPVHLQMVIDAPLKLNTFTVTPLVAWIRLALQPVLIAWAWWYTNAK